ncbi:MAG TPA: sigma-70 family RNA polymerase sigma factor [Phycisphaerales bacterium]|nr:sigma-70 family RNA polymerase sigma factor [Phycisphaerales bacterium]
MPAAPHQPTDPPSTSPPLGPVATAEDLADLRLVTAIHAGDPRAWHDLLSKYQDRLYGVCLRVIGDSPRARQTAADLTQDALVKIIQGLGTYDGSAKLSTWMIRVTMNVCLSHLRAQKLRRHSSLDTPAGGRGRSGGSSVAAATGGSGPEKWGPSLGDLLAHREPNPVERVSHEQTRQMVTAALATIEPEQRALLVLRDAKGLDYHQIAQVLDVPVGTIKSRIFRARLALREACEQLSKRRT